MSKPEIRGVYIKLGSDCNLHCKYCHSEHVDVDFNPLVLPVLKKLNLRVIAFGGGEPLIYWSTIKWIMSYIGNSVSYKIVTNGTLLSQEIVDFCNQYRVIFAISLDGIGSTRDMSKPVPWHLVKQLRQCGTAVTFYNETQNIRQSLESLNAVKRDYLSVYPVIWSSFPNFVHSTSKTGVLSDKALADSYVSQMSDLLREAFQLYVDHGRHITLFLKRCFQEFVQKKDIHGVRCFNNHNILMLADGTLCICTYTLKKVGTIFDLHKIDWDLIRIHYSRPSCQNCQLYDICGDFCCQDVTDNRCYVQKSMYKVMISLMKYFDVSYEELDSYR